MTNGKIQRFYEKYYPCIDNHLIQKNIFLCRYPDSNRDALALLPKSNVSTNFTIAAIEYYIDIFSIKQSLKDLQTQLTIEFTSKRGILQFVYHLGMMEVMGSNPATP